MDTYYLVLVVILILLAISDLIVGVANDAVNFLNSAVGSKVASKYVILGVASLGVLIGSLFSGGMMEVARKGVFRPEYFYLSEIMVIFLAVMITDILLLDFFNTIGIPTSTTVSLVFELLGSAVAVSTFKIIANGESFTNIGTYINSGKALAMISGILISVVVAFVIGAIVQYIARFLFSFNYTKSMGYIGGIWGGIALTAITYFILMKGLEGSSVISESMLAYIKEHTWRILFYGFIIWVSIFQICISIFRLNILRFIVLAGTFALALSFAGNDLVNFIGVSMAGLKAVEIHIANPGVPADQLLMTDLAKPVAANVYYLLAAGFIMLITLWISKKARSVIDTTVNLARQDVGSEQFGSSQFSRSLVRVARKFGDDTGRLIPRPVKEFVASRFDTSKAPKYKNLKEAPSFDLIRASVNLTVAGILISSATSLKLPLSTTYVTFMVAMGTSLSDQAWGRESAVYRITGVLAVITSWFFTALIAFSVSFAMAAAIYYGKVPALIILLAISVALLIRSSFIHKKRVAIKNADAKAEEDYGDESIVIKCTNNVIKSLRDVINTYKQTIDGLSNENRKMLKKVNAEVDDLNSEAKRIKYNVYNVLKKLHEDSIETGHYYVQVVDYLREIAHSLKFVTGPSFEHIDNHHKGLLKEQNEELQEISKQIAIFFDQIIMMIKENDYTDTDKAIKKQQDILELLNNARKKQVKRIKLNESGTRNSVLYMGLLNEIKNIMLQTLNLLKAQRDFILKNTD